MTDRARITRVRLVCVPTKTDLIFENKNDCNRIDSMKTKTWIKTNKPKISHFWSGWGSNSRPWLSAAPRSVDWANGTLLVAVAFIGSCHSWKLVFFFIKVWTTLNYGSAEKLDCELVQALTAQRTASWVIAPLSLFPRHRYFATLFASLGCSQTQHLSEI